MLAMRQEEERRLKALEAVQKKLGVQVPVMAVPAAVAASGAAGSGGAGAVAGSAAGGAPTGSGSAGAAVFDDGRDVGGR